MRYDDLRSGRAQILRSMFYVGDGCVCYGGTSGIMKQNFLDAMCSINDMLVSGSPHGSHDEMRYDDPRSGRHQILRSMFHVGDGRSLNNKW